MAVPMVGRCCRAVRGVVSPPSANTVRRWATRACGASPASADLAAHYYSLLLEQVAAVLPITCTLVVVMAAFFRRRVENAGELAGGLIAAIVGLALFIDALRVCVMPLGELLGRELPQKLPVWATLVVVGFLGAWATRSRPAASRCHGHPRPRRRRLQASW